MDEKVLADARAAFPARKALVTIGSKSGHVIRGRETTQVARGNRGALLGPPPGRRRF